MDDDSNDKTDSFTPCTCVQGNDRRTKPIVGDGIDTIVSQESAHSLLIAHVPNFKGASIQTYTIYIPGNYPHGPKLQVIFEPPWAFTWNNTVQQSHTASHYYWYIYIKLVINRHRIPDNAYITCKYDTMYTTSLFADIPCMMLVLCVCIGVICFSACPLPLPTVVICYFIIHQSSS